MKDIENRDDIILLVDAFYKKVIPDPVIGHFFTGVVNFSWTEHIPILISFWETILLGATSYKGNPMMKHVALNKLATMEKEHFERWLLLWEQTIIEHFEGVTASHAIARANTIAGLMQSKINVS